MKDNKKWLQKPFIFTVIFSLLLSLNMGTHIFSMWQLLEATASVSADLIDANQVFNGEVNLLDPSRSVDTCPVPLGSLNSFQYFEQIVGLDTYLLSSSTGYLSEVALDIENLPTLTTVDEASKRLISNSYYHILKALEYLRFCGYEYSSVYPFQILFTDQQTNLNLKSEQQYLVVYYPDWINPLDIYKNVAQFYLSRIVYPSIINTELKAYLESTSIYFSYAIMSYHKRNPMTKWLNDNALTSLENRDIEAQYSFTPGATDQQALNENIMAIAAAFWKLREKMPERFLGQVLIGSFYEVDHIFQLADLKILLEKVNQYFFGGRYLDCYEEVLGDLGVPQERFLNIDPVGDKKLLEGEQLVISLGIDGSHLNDVTVKVFDLNGNEIPEILIEEQAGKYTLKWDTTSNDIGERTLVLRVSDGVLERSITFDVEVIEKSRYLSLSALQRFEGRVGEELQIEITVDSSHPEQVALRLVQSVGNANLEQKSFDTYVIYYTPSTDEVGEQVFRIEGDDSIVNDLIEIIVNVKDIVITNEIIPKISELKLIDTQTDQIVSSLVSGGVYPKKYFSVLAIAEDEEQVTRVAFYLDGQRVRTDSRVPYTLGRGSSNYREFDISEGMHTLKVVPIYKDVEQDIKIKGEPFEVSFEIVDENAIKPKIEKLNVLNTRTGQVVAELENGEEYSSLDFTVVAEVEDPDMVTHVAFYLDGVHRKTEYNAPYALGGDRSGRFNPVRIRSGDHQIRVVPYYEKDREKVQGEAVVVNFKIKAPNFSGGGTRPTLVRPSTVNIDNILQAQKVQDMLKKLRDFFGSWRSRFNF